MLTQEERELLGLASGVTERRSSAISQVLRAVRDTLDSRSSNWEVEGEAQGELAYRLQVASTRVQRERAYALAQTAYRECGYSSREQNEWCLTPFDAHPETITLVAEDAHENAIGTISLIFDSSAGLPCDSIFGNELSKLRAQNRRLVEVTRLAFAKPHTHSKQLLVRLFNFIYVYARRVKGYDDFVIEVNPRHVNYYQRLLRFEEIGSARSCPRVNGAPAVLMGLDLRAAESEIRQFGGQGAAAKERSLYPYFYTWLEEGAAAEFMARQQRPMSHEERLYFGLFESSVATASSTTLG